MTNKQTDKQSDKQTDFADCISRQALCEYALNQKDKSITPNDIMRFPSVEPERKHGEWIEQEGFDGDVYYDIILSLCRPHSQNRSGFRVSALFILRHCLKAKHGADVACMEKHVKAMTTAHGQSYTERMVKRNEVYCGV